MKSMLDYSSVLIALGGLCWITIYVEAVRIGFRDKSYAIPFWAIGLNFSWEAFYSIFSLKEEGASLQSVVLVLRLLLDLGVLITWFKFGRKHFPENPGYQWFVPWSMLVIIISFILQFAFAMQVGFIPARDYAAFLQIFVMSLLFIAMLARRKHRKGQSMIIATVKLFGSIFLTILFGILGTDDFHGPNYFLLTIGIMSCLFDLIYIALLSKARLYEKKDHSASMRHREATGGEFDSFRV
jgi:hypothetical protein